MATRSRDQLMIAYCEDIAWVQATPCYFHSVTHMAERLFRRTRQLIFWAAMSDLEKNGVQTTGKKVFRGRSKWDPLAHEFDRELDDISVLRSRFFRAVASNDALWRNILRNASLAFPPIEFDLRSFATAHEAAIALTETVIGFRAHATTEKTVRQRCVTLHRLLSQLDCPDLCSRLHAESRLTIDVLPEELANECDFCGTGTEDTSAAANARNREVVAGNGQKSPQRPTPLVELRGHGQRPVVCGREVAAIAQSRYGVIEALLKAGPSGLSKSELEAKNSHAIRYLRDLRKSRPWKSAIRMAGKAGRKYSIVHQ